MNDELLENLIACRTWIHAAIVDLDGDPSLAENPHWRESLAEFGYRIETLMSEED